MYEHAQPCLLFSFYSFSPRVWWETGSDTLPIVHNRWNVCITIAIYLHKAVTTTLWHLTCVPLPKTSLMNTEISQQPWQLQMMDTDGLTKIKKIIIIKTCFTVSRLQEPRMTHNIFTMKMWWFGFRAGFMAQLHDRIYGRVNYATTRLTM